MRLTLAIEEALLYTDKDITFDPDGRYYDPSYKERLAAVRRILGSVD